MPPPIAGLWDAVKGGVVLVLGVGLWCAALVILAAAIGWL